MDSDSGARDPMTFAEMLAEAVERARSKPLTPQLAETLRRLLVDVGGLCVAARREPYVRATLDGWESDGRSTALGHARALDAAGAAFVNGTAAHGEDYDDTFEGGPVHAGAVIVPAVLAVAERERLAAHDAAFGIAVGLEITCRASLVAPKKIHKAGFHPTAVLGAMGAAAGVAAAVRASRAQFVAAQGIAGSMASGIIEYLAEGTWTKRMHPGWAAQSGIRAVDIARKGFTGPRTVWEGAHGFLHGFANTTEGAWDKLTDGFGERWVTESIAFKPYPCGTMIHPYIDCARRLAARGVKDTDIREIVCDVGEGTVHRLWEPLAAKQRPPNGYAAKFSQPWVIAYAIVHGHVGLEAFADERMNDARVAALAAKIRYRIDPANPYPDAFTGHIEATLVDGRKLEERQGHFRGGAQEPLSAADIEEKFRANCAYGGWDAERISRWLELAPTTVIPGARNAGNDPGPIVDLAPFRG
jgi:2-methylcitrate dehydratase PrpD